MKRTITSWAIFGFLSFSPALGWAGYNNSFRHYLVMQLDNGQLLKPRSYRTKAECQSIARFLQRDFGIGSNQWVCLRYQSKGENLITKLSLNIDMGAEVLRLKYMALTDCNAAASKITRIFKPLRLNDKATFKFSCNPDNSISSAVN